MKASKGYKSATRVLQECYKTVTGVLQECYKSVTRVVQEWYERNVTSLSACSRHQD